MLFWEPISLVLNLFATDARVASIPILFQTNGIEIGRDRVDLDRLFGNRTTPILVELSFKGTNCKEFELLTKRSPELFQYQVNAYHKLRELSSTNQNIRVVAVVGVYHSAVQGLSQYAFVNPETGDLLFDNDELWDEQFREIWYSAELKWVEPLRMSPLGVWKTVLKRCGPDGAGILAYFPQPKPTNTKGLFPPKPEPPDYARLICEQHFWEKIALEKLFQS